MVKVTTRDLFAFLACLEEVFLVRLASSIANALASEYDLSKHHLPLHIAWFLSGLGKHDIYDPCY